MVSLMSRESKTRFQNAGDVTDVSLVGIVPLGLNSLPSLSLAIPGL
jgi:hypothetical protein